MRRNLLRAAAVCALLTLLPASPAGAAGLPITATGPVKYTAAAPTGTFSQVRAVTLDVGIDEAAPAVSSPTPSVNSAVAANGRALFAANLSGISSTAVVTAATLRVTQDTPSARSLAVRRVTSAWTAGTTWATRPTVAAAPTATAAPTSGVYSLDVAADVAAFVATPASNFGWELRDTVESSAVPVATPLVGSEAATQATATLTVSYYLPIVDTLASAPRAAYSLRKLRAGYTGAAIQVRRSSDSSLADIGFSSAGVLDTAALAAFVGAGDGFVRTWYDQSTNGYHLTNTTAAQQPRIVISGTRQPAVRFSAAASNHLQNTAATGIAATSSWYLLLGLTSKAAPATGLATDGTGWYFVDRTSATNGLWSLKAVSSSGTKYCLQRRSDSGANLGCVTSTSAIPTGATQVVATHREFGTSMSVWVNGTREATSVVAPSESITPPPLRIGSHTSSGVGVNTEYVEVIMLGHSPTVADRQRLEGSLAWFAGNQSSLPAAHPYRSGPPS